MFPRLMPNTNMSKTKIMKANTNSKNVVTVEGKPLEAETYCFTWPEKSAKLEAQKTTLQLKKTCVAFLILSKIWKSKPSRLKTKMRIFNVKSSDKVNNNTLCTTTNHLPVEI